MNKNPNGLYKFIVIGVTIFFIGVGFQPAFAITPNTTESEEECDIWSKVCKQHLALISSYLIRLENYDNQLLVLSKLNPDIEEEYKEFSEKILILKQLNQVIKHNSIFKNNNLACLFLFLIGIIAAFFWITNYQILDVVSFIINIKKHPFMAIFFYFNYYFWGLLMLKAASLMVDLECFGQFPSPWFQSIISIKSICTLSETNDITNLAKGCPCLQY